MSDDEPAAAGYVDFNGNPLPPVDRTKVDVDLSEFGYGQICEVLSPWSIEVHESKDHETLGPLVVLLLRFAPQEGQVPIALAPHQAYEVGMRLLEFTKTAIDRHWE